MKKIETHRPPMSATSPLLSLGYQILNCFERAEFDAGPSKRAEKQIGALVQMLARFEEFRQFDSDLTRDYERGYQILCEGMARRKAKSMPLFLPFVFMTMLPLAVVHQVRAVHSAHEPLDETQFPASVPREALESMFKFVRQIDANPDKFVLGFIYSVPEDKFATVFAEHCAREGCRQAHHQSMHERVADGEVTADQSAVEPGKPNADQQRIDATAVMACLAMPQVKAQIVQQLVDRKLRGRLLVVMHKDDSCSATYQVLDDKLATILSTNVKSTDHTLEWIRTCDISTQMVVTVQSDENLESPAHSYLMMQPWCVD